MPILPIMQRPLRRQSELQQHHQHQHQTSKSTEIRRQARRKEITDFVSIPSPEIPVGGHIQNFVPAWRDLTSDLEIIKIVEGLDIPLVEVQHQSHIPHPLQVSADETKAADEQIQQLLQKGAIEECQHTNPDDFVSTVRPKKDGGYHMIWNLKDFNKFVEYNHFKMETLKDICQSITPNCFMAVIDLQDAYLVIPISRHHQRFLKFIWKGKIYCYLVLPFSLACAPRIFTKLLKVPLSEIREMRTHCFHVH